MSKFFNFIKKTKKSKIITMACWFFDFSYLFIGSYVLVSMLQLVVGIVKNTYEYYCLHQEYEHNLQKIRFRRFNLIFFFTFEPNLDLDCDTNSTHKKKTKTENWCVIDVLYLYLFLFSRDAASCIHFLDISAFCM